MYEMGKHIFLSQGPVPPNRPSNIIRPSATKKGQYHHGGTELIVTTTLTPVIHHNGFILGQENSVKINLSTDCFSFMIFVLFNKRCMKHILL